MLSHAWAIWRLREPFGGVRDNSGSLRRHESLVNTVRDLLTTWGPGPLVAGSSG